MKEFDESAAGLGLPVFVPAACVSARANQFWVSWTETPRAGPRTEAASDACIRSQTCVLLGECQLSLASLRVMSENHHHHCSLYPSLDTWICLARGFYGIGICKSLALENFNQAGRDNLSRVRRGLMPGDFNARQEGGWDACWGEGGFQQRRWRTSTFLPARG